MSKIVYQTDPAGAYVGPVVADKNPLEPGAYLIPYGCVDVAPPDIPDGSQAYWDGSAWVIAELPPEVDTAPPLGPTPQELFLQERDRRLRAAIDILDRHRNQKEYNIPTTIADEQAREWAIYAQDLRELPELIDDPAAPEWPATPIAR